MVTISNSEVMIQQSNDDFAISRAGRGLKMGQIMRDLMYACIALKYYVIVYKSM